MFPASRAFAITRTTPELTGMAGSIQSNPSRSSSAADANAHHRSPSEIFTSSVLLKNNRYHWFRKPEPSPATRALLLFSCRHPARTGGAGRDRTDDPLLAKQVLSQLSYSPRPFLVGLDGFEPSTPALSRRCSNQLSYRPASRFGPARPTAARHGNNR